MSRKWDVGMGMALNVSVKIKHWVPPSLHSDNLLMSPLFLLSRLQDLQMFLFSPTFPPLPLPFFRYSVMHCFTHTFLCAVHFSFLQMNQCFTFSKEEEQDREVFPKNFKHIFSCVPGVFSLLGKDFRCHRKKDLDHSVNETGEGQGWLAYCL